MVTQIRLIFIAESGRNMLPFEKRVEIKETDLSDLGDSVGVFMEYYKVSVRFECTIPSATLEIDSSTSIYPIFLKSGETKVLSEGQDSDLMLTPGHYGIRITTPLKIYEGLYYIKPSSLSFNAIVNLRNYLETVLKGLSQTLYVQRLANQNNIFGEDDYFLYKIFNYIYGNKDMLMDNVDSIIKNPITDITKEYREQNYSRKADNKSQKWLSKKGTTRNAVLYLPAITYEQHSVLTNDIIANRWIKRIVAKAIEVLCELETRYSRISNQLNKKINVKLGNVRDLEAKCSELSKDKTVVQNFIYSKQNDVKFTKEEIQRLSKQVKFIGDILSKVMNIKSQLLHYMYETWLKEIDGYDKITKPVVNIFMDNRYNALYEFYNSIMFMDERNAYNKKPMFPSKKSSKLFEYYATYLVISILMENGYEWRKGWLGNGGEPELFNGEIPSSEIMTFYSRDGSIRCEVAYDKEIEMDHDIMGKNISDFVRINARHYMPDIRVAFFENATNQLVSAFIIEVKCCRSKYIYSENGPTYVIEQVKDYCNLGYYDKDSKKKKKTKQGVIEEVIVVYPKQEKQIQYGYDDFNISFIQVEPSESKDLNDHYGYKKLKKEIEKYIDFVKEKIAG